MEGEHLNKTRSLILNDDDSIKWEHDGKLYCLHVQYDREPPNPRKDWDNPGTVMACWHRRYNLGDDIEDKEPEDFWHRLVRENVPEAEILEAAKAGKLKGIRLEANKENGELVDIYETSYWRAALGDSEPVECLEYEGVAEDAVAAYLLDDLTIGHCMILMEPYAAWLNLWLYDHSGITMSCGSGNPFSCQWDSGQVGWIFVTKEAAIREFCECVLDENGERIKVEHPHEGGASTWSYLTRPLTDETWKNRAREIMEGEVEVYDQYLTGEVYGYTVYEAVPPEDDDDEPDWQEGDSCWGFFGDDIMENGIADEAGDGLRDAIMAGAYETGKAVLHTLRYYSF